MGIETVTLSTGEEVPKTTWDLVTEELPKLDHIGTSGALFDLVSACHDSDYVCPEPDDAHLLLERGLIEEILPSGQVRIRDDVHAVVMEATKGEGITIGLKRPYPPRSES